jgi:hypothetical protein
MSDQPYREADHFWQERDPSPFTGPSTINGALIPPTGDAGQQPMAEPQPAPTIPLPPGQR